MCEYTGFKALFVFMANGGSFFSGCHYFVPLWDKTYDTYESYIERTPFSTNGEPSAFALFKDLLTPSRSPGCGGKDQSGEWTSRRDFSSMFGGSTGHRQINSLRPNCQKGSCDGDAHSLCLVAERMAPLRVCASVVMEIRKHRNTNRFMIGTHFEEV